MHQVLNNYEKHGESRSEHIQVLTKGKYVIFSPSAIRLLLDIRGSSNSGSLDAKLQGGQTEPGLFS